jgi:formylmethanofuran dehydrogenase subunit E
MSLKDILSVPTFKTLSSAVFIGRVMLNPACGYLPEDGLFDVVCKTAKCLPDALRMLTNCKVGYSHLRIGFEVTTNLKKQQNFGHEP